MVSTLEEADAGLDAEYCAGAVVKTDLDEYVDPLDLQG